MANGKLIFLSFMNLILGVFIGYFLFSDRIRFSSNWLSSNVSTKRLLDNSLTISPHVQIVDANEPINATFQCVKSKKLLNHISPIICLYETRKDMHVSRAFNGEVSIWEEPGVTRILELLLRYPHLDFIDIGANIGTYTMYVAALGRFVLAIDCFAPNMDRLRRALQLTNVTNRVVLIQNALFPRSGETLRLSFDSTNVGGQALLASNNNQTNNHSAKHDPYLVTTIQFDELLPILISRRIRGAIVKIDIESSESFVMESGSGIFDSLEIPYVQMEWFHVVVHPDRVKIILEFFAKRNYQPATFSCQLLLYSQHSAWPIDVYWIKGNLSNFC